MTTGVAIQASVNAAWIARTLRSAHLETFTTSSHRVCLTTEVGTVTIAVDERRGLLRFRANVGDETSVPSTTDPIALGGHLRILREATTIARVTWYEKKDEEPELHMEYEWPVVAGLSRGQFLATLRVFLADVAVVRRLAKGDR